MNEDYVTPRGIVSSQNQYVTEWIWNTKVWLRFWLYEPKKVFSEHRVGLFRRKGLRYGSRLPWVRLFVVAWKGCLETYAIVPLFERAQKKILSERGTPASLRAVHSGRIMGQEAVLSRRAWAVPFLSVLISSTTVRELPHRPFPCPSDSPLRPRRKHRPCPAICLTMIYFAPNSHISESYRINCRCFSDTDPCYWICYECIVYGSICVWKGGQYGYGKL